jgi:hypothetical protein
MILAEIGTIDHHVFQHINTNEYEEGNSYVRKGISNTFVEFKQSKKIIAKSASYFNQILEIEEGHNVIEHDKCKKSFFDNLSNNVLKNVSKKHVILKQDVYEFVYSNDNMIPANRNVMDLFCMLNHKSYILVKNKMFYTFKFGDEYQETFVLYDKPPSHEVVFHKFQTVAEAQSNLTNSGYIQNVILKNLKLAELKAYANLHNIKIEHLKKKDELIDHIDTYIKNKN